VRLVWHLPSGAVDAYERSLVQHLLSGVARAGERYGRHRIIAMLRGDIGDLPAALSKLPTTGVLRHETAGTLYRWIDAAVAADLVVVSKDQYRTLRLSEQGREVVSGRSQDLAIKRPSMPVGLSGYRRYRDDLPREPRADLMFRSRAGRFGRWDKDPW
jgi:superfamily II DNA helicase RecQ